MGRCLSQCVETAPAHCPSHTWAKRRAKSTLHTPVPSELSGGSALPEARTVIAPEPQPQAGGLGRGEHHLYPQLALGCYHQHLCSQHQCRVPCPPPCLGGTTQIPQDFPLSPPLAARGFSIPPHIPEPTCPSAARVTPATTSCFNTFCGSQCPWRTAWAPACLAPCGLSRFLRPTGTEAPPAQGPPSCQG